MKLLIIYLCLGLTGLAHAQQPNVIPAGYSVETLDLPPGVQLGATGLDVAANGDVYVASRFGEVWRLRGSSWTLVAEGLHEATGLLIDSDGLFVMQRPELSQLVDEDGDGVTDFYKTVSAGFGFSGNYHEYAFGPVRDKQGNFYGTLNLSHGGGTSVHGSIMHITEPYRGTCIKITPSGDCSVFAWGLRSPAGIGISPDDELFYTDNQGDWNATSTLHHMVDGRFHGHPGSLKYHPDFKDRDLNAIKVEEYEALRTRPAIWIPHGAIANSPGNPEWDVTQGKFGPFAGQVFIGDQSRSNIFRVMLEKVGGEYQGGVINFIDHLQCGVIRLAFAPDGSLWAGETGRGWGSVGGKIDGLQRIVYDGRTVPFALEHISLTADGFDLTFTHPVAGGEAVSAYAVESWGYHYHGSYGSPLVDQKRFAPTSVAVDGKTVHLKMPLEVNKVYRIGFDVLKGPAGEVAASRSVYYTLNQLR
jgi:hypothetical protein